MQLLSKSSSGQPPSKNNIARKSRSTSNSVNRGPNSNNNNNSSAKRLHNSSARLRLKSSTGKRLPNNTRQLRLSIKQLVPTSLVEYLEEHNQGDLVSGRVIEQSPGSALIELGEGIRVTCPIAASAPAAAASQPSSGVDLSALTSMLNARWKGNTKPSADQLEPLSLGQIRSFRIAKLDRDTQTIEVGLA